MASQADTLTNIGSSATPTWAMAPPPNTGNQYVDVVLIVVQLAGMVACIKGFVKVMHYVTPGHRSAPPTLWTPLIQIVVGMFAMVPDAVYAVVTDLLARFGWG